MKKDVVVAEYQGIAVPFSEDGWFNATAVADRFGKRPADWLNLDSTKEYVEALASMLRSEKSSLLKVKRGGRGMITITLASIPLRGGQDGKSLFTVILAASWTQMSVVIGARMRG